MISFEEAYEKVLQNPLELGIEKCSILEVTGRILAEDIQADRDFPPFNRSTKDGIALNFKIIEKGTTRLNIEGVLSAGSPQQTLSSEENCFEIMTGAVLPHYADTIVMYEETEIKNGWATLTTTPKKGQNIHTQGSDKRAGETLVEKGATITPAIIGVLASVGKTEVLVKKLPKVCVISTGNELVEVSETPLPHQIRKSNSLSLTAALRRQGIQPTRLHLQDDRERIQEALRKVLKENNVVMLSGGVSKGKFDFIPDALESLGVRKVFHRVAQRPGKPFWFGIVDDADKVVFSFPGNPVSTFANYHIYFLPWLGTCLGQKKEELTVILEEPILPHPKLTRFLQVKTERHKGRLHAKLVNGNGSGDLVSLALADGFVCLPKGEEEVAKGAQLPYIPCV